MAELRVWQRRHGDDIVAEVSPVQGMGTWDICAWREPDRRETRGGRFGWLADAHHGADTLAQLTFDHRCDSRCGVWNAVERRRRTRATTR
jgi:hypothetical protein